MRTPETPSADYDEYWKEAIDLFLPGLLRLLAPDLAAAIDLDHALEPLPAELLKNPDDLATKTVDSDRCFLVRLVDGRDAIVHVEPQCQPDASFPERMFVYHARLYLKRRLPVVSFALLADPSPTFRPTEFRHRGIESGCSFSFRAVKILDLRDRAPQLLYSNDPASIVVAIRLFDLDTPRKDHEARLAKKIELLLAITASDLRIETRGKLSRLLMSGFPLPRRHEARFRAELVRLEQEQAMPFMTIYEKEALERGRSEGKAEGKGDAILTILKMRFAELPKSLVDRIHATKDVERLDAGLVCAVTVSSLSEFERAFARTG